MGDAAGEARALVWMAFNRWGTGDDDEIGAVLAAACDLARSTGRTLETAIALGLSGTWWSLRADGACRLLGAAERMRELLGTAAPPYERIVRERGLRAVKAALDDRTAAGAWERGRQLGFEGAMAQARALASGPPERS